MFRAVVLLSDSQGSSSLPAAVHTGCKPIYLYPALPAGLIKSPRGSHVHAFPINTHRVSSCNITRLGGPAHGETNRAISSRPHFVPGESVAQQLNTTPRRVHVCLSACCFLPSTATGWGTVLQAGRARLLFPTSSLHFQST